MEIAQTTDSLEIITEIDPLEIAEIFGNIGGFWGKSTSDEFMPSIAHEFCVTFLLITSFISEYKVCSLWVLPHPIPPLCDVHFIKLKERGLHPSYIPNSRAFCYASCKIPELLDCKHGISL